MNIRTNVAGTMAPYFSIGKNGPTIFQGSFDPNTQSLTSHSGDLYVRVGATSHLYQFTDNTWVQVGTVDPYDVANAVEAFLANTAVPTANTLSTARTISISGDASGSTTFDGSANAAIAIALANSGVTAGTYSLVTVDEKGRVTSGSNLSGSTITTALGYTPINPSAATTISNSLTVTGNLTVTGSTLTVDSVVTTLADPVLTLGSGSTSTDDGKDRGIEFKFGNGTAVRTGFFGFDRSTGTFTVLDDVTNASEVFAGSVGTITANLIGNVTGAASEAAKWSTARTLSLQGDATGSVAIDGSANASVTVALANSGASAGTYGNATIIPVVTVDAKGRVVSIANVAASGGGVTSVAGKTGVVSLVSADITDATSDATGSRLVVRDSDGSFAANVVTARLSGIANTANAWTTARTVTLSGDVTASASVSGSADVTFTTALANSGVTAGTYGNATILPTITVDAKGRVTSVANSAISFPVASVAGRTGAVSLTSADITDATSAATGSRIVLRDADGSFSANVVTARLSGIATTANAWTTARTLTLSGDVTASASVTGSADVSFTTALANSGVTAGTYGNATVIPVVTVDAKGRVTSIANVAASGGGVTSVAGRTGAVTLTSADITDATSAATASKIVTRDSDGSFSANVVTARLSGIATTANAWTTARTFTLSGDVTASASVSGSADVSFTTALANSGVTSGTYGNATIIPVVTVDAKGRVTSVANTAISFPVSSVAGKTGAVSIVSADITDATSAATGSRIVLRDADGSFSANVVTARLSGIAATANAWTTARTFTLSGDMTGSASVSGSADVSFTTVLANSGVTAGTYGNASSLATITVDAKGRVTSVANTAISFPVASVAGKTGAISLVSADITDATSAATGSRLVLRDSDGSFSANVVTARLSGIATTANAWTTARTFTLSGDVTASASVSGAGNVTFTTTLANSGVTTGTYGNATILPTVTVDAKGRVTSIANTAISFPVASVAGKTGAVSLTSADITDATSAATGSRIVLRDADGSFSANVVTARLSGIATTANAWTTARTFTLSGDVTASASVTGSANVTFATTLANSGATAGTYGNAAVIPVVTVDAKGRVTSIANVATDSLPLTGGVLTGSIRVDTNGSEANISVDTNSAVHGFFQVLTDGNFRWRMGKTNAAESGSNAGGDFAIYRYSDTGAYLGRPLYISRATGDWIIENTVSISGKLNTSASTTTRAGFNIPHGSAPTSPTNGDVWTTTSGVFAHVNGSSLQLSDTTHVHSASVITSTATGNISATNVQAALAELDSEKLARTGGTMTGNLLMSGASLSVDAASGASTAMYLGAESTMSALYALRNKPTNALRWQFGKNPTAESGSNAGSDYALYRYDDSGAYLGRAYQFTRSSGDGIFDGNIAISGKLTTSASTATRSGLNLPHGSAPTSPTNGDVWTTTTGVFAHVNGSSLQLSGGVTSVAGRSGAVTLTSADITDATSANTANVIVERDANGSFAANVATLERLAGNATASVSQYRANTASLVLTTDQVWSAAGLVALTDNTTVVIDLASGINFSVTLGGNRTLGNPSNTKVGQTGIIYVAQDGVGSKTLAYGSNYKFSGGSAPSLTTTANAVDRLIYFVRSSTHIDIDISRDRR